MIEFVNNFSKIQDQLTDGISQTLEREMTTLTSNIVDKLGTSLSKVESATEQLTGNSNRIGEMVKATNELHIKMIENNRS